MKGRNGSDGVLGIEVGKSYGLADGLLQPFSIGQDAGNRQIYPFCLVIPSPKAHRLAIEAVTLELSDLSRLHRTALQRETFQRGRGEVGQIGGLDSTEIPLCVDMEADGLCHLCVEPPRQPGPPHGFVPSIDAFLGDVFFQPMYQVSNIMEQGRYNQTVWSSLLFGKVRRLERVLELRDWLAEVGVSAPLLEHA